MHVGKTPEVCAALLGGVWLQHCPVCVALPNCCLDCSHSPGCTCSSLAQVELAQTEYQLPRLTRMWTHLDRVGGGGQVKGTGE